MAASTINYTWGLDAKGLAHACHSGYATAICGVVTRRSAPATGTPCSRCVQYAVEETLAAEG